MKYVGTLPGRVLYADGPVLYRAKGAALLRSEDAGQHWEKLRKPPWSGSSYLLAGVPAVARLLRLGIHSLVAGESAALVIANRHTYLLENGHITSIGPLVGSRPLAVVAHNESFYYGEYRSNRQRSPVHVWKYASNGDGWRPVWQFNNVRHIHGVFHDPYSDQLWVTTGDRNDEAAIWRTDDCFGSLERVVGGAQWCRAVQLLFTRDHVYFGSDTPLEKNYIYRMNRDGGGVERLAAVGSSVFYGCRVGNDLFFSTAVEPSSVNTTGYAQVWHSPDGNQWDTVMSFKSDPLPSKYFQYAQVLFPTGPGDNEHVYLTPFATRRHYTTFVFKLEA
ncbi:MAG: hypothetical protein ACLFM0_05375 [Spirochaetales bacterium]